MGFFGDLRNALKNAEPVDRVVAEHGRISRLYCTKTNPCREAQYHESGEVVYRNTDLLGETVLKYRCSICGCEWFAAES